MNHSNFSRRQALAALASTAVMPMLSACARSVAALAPPAPAPIPPAGPTEAQATALLDSIAGGRIDARSLNVAQARRLLALQDAEISRRVTETWGTLRESRNPEREKVIAWARAVIADAPGDAWHGKAVFDKVCAQCHTIFGDGQQYRDFVYVGNVVDANIRAATTPGIGGRAYNVGCGHKTTLIELLDTIEKIAGSKVERTFAEPRAGDIRESVADIGRIQRELGYDPQVGVEDGLRRLIAHVKGKG